MTSKPRRNIASISFEVGRLACAEVRDRLEGLRFRGNCIEWWESSGWFTREFVVKGTPESILEVAAKLNIKL